MTQHILIVQENGNFNAYAAKKVLVTSLPQETVLNIENKKLKQACREAFKNIKVGYENGNGRDINAGSYITKLEPQGNGINSFQRLDFIPASESDVVVEASLLKHRTADVRRKLGL